VTAVRLAHNGLELWYATEDAPAPDAISVGREGVSVTVGVRPSNPSNAVRIRYRVDGRGVQILSAPLASTDFPNRTQYFTGVFPTFWSGERVEYLPVLSCAGRQAPDPATAATFPSSFRLDAFPPARAQAQRPAEPVSQPMFPVVLDYMVHVSVPLIPKPQIIGQTPGGFIVNWPPIGGTLSGPAFQAVVIPGGEHQVIVRPDGMAILTSSVTVESYDHALISLRHTGTVDYGRDWAQWLRDGRWPPALPVRKEIRILTAHPRYEWLNRLQCIGVGEVRPAEAFYTYDMYSIR
jgi:hypothetical protein